eukprot:1993781-Pleurochrysis_carterae.AAC.3
MSPSPHARLAVVTCVGCGAAAALRAGPPIPDDAGVRVHAPAASPGRERAQLSVALLQRRRRIRAR